MIPIDRRRGEGVAIGLFTRLKVLDTSPGEACIQIEAYPEGAQIALSGRHHVFGEGNDQRIDTARGQPVVIWQSRMTSICIAGCIYCALTNVKRGAVELVLQAPRTLIIDRCERRRYVTSTTAGHFQVGHDLFWFEGRGEQLILFRGQLAQWDDTDPVRGWLAEVTVGSMSSIVNPPLSDMELPDEHWSP